MKKKRIVITGGPGAGKTSLIDELCTKGYRTHAEYSRSLIQKAQSEGTLNYFLSHPQEFSEALFEGRKHQYHNIPTNLEVHDSPYVFFDRGIHDIYAYLKAINQHSETWYQRMIEFQYDLVFLLEPWPDIYTQDEHRKESFQEAERYFSEIHHVYREQHQVILVPKESIALRTAFIENYLRDYER